MKNNPILFRRWKEEEGKERVGGNEREGKGTLIPSLSNQNKTINKQKTNEIKTILNKNKK